MKSDEVDKIIEEALAQSRHSHSKRQLSRERIALIRKILNTIFIIGVISTFVVYFAIPDNKMLFFSIGFGSLIIKIIEFIIRFAL
ncbi:MAG: hypothetical protein KBT06_03845 [Prevotellaceae bacterium]|nr:hypothetical protein [Candidatus Colivivens equi]MCQ2076544.1 hypothetical protein [Bacteroidaceae bacterium]